MTKNKFTKQDLIEILIKKASGFYYTEEQCEYEKMQNKNISNKIPNNNLSFFDFSDRGNIEFYNDDDTIKLSNENKLSEQNIQNLTLVKKKVATHYISPDINAIKILFEILENKVGENDLKNLSNDELLLLKNKLIEELYDELN